MFSMTSLAPALPDEKADSQRLKRSLRLVEFRKKLAALSLVAPLVVFLLAVFVVPVAVLLMRAIDNPEVVEAFPGTTSSLTGWEVGKPVPLGAYPALLADLKSASADQIGAASARLNREHSGFRSLIRKTAAAIPLTANDKQLDPAEIRDRLVQLDERWADTGYWRDISRNGSRYTSAYLLAAVDYKVNQDGQIAAVEDGASNYQGIFGRTFLVSAAVTLSTLVLGYPLAFWIAGLPARKANLALILVLLPFWTSILVRIAAWIVLLQGEGLVNKLLMSIGLTQAPHELLFNRVGVLIAMTHILLPFMILPLYSVMKSVPPSYQKAAVSLGSHPFGAFWKVYVPQTYAGVGAGAVLVFILALGYYITPALLGGAGDQMVSYYVAYFTTVTMNWGLACALGALLLIATLVLYAAYRWLAGK